MQWTVPHASSAKRHNARRSDAWIYNIAAAPIRLWGALIAAYQHRKAVAELEVLDDHLLKDIGICRGEIDCFVNFRRSAHNVRMHHRMETTGQW